MLRCYEKLLGTLEKLPKRVPVKNYESEINYMINIKLYL